MKLVVDADSVVGVHIVGPDSEMIQLAAIAVKAMTKAQWDATCAVRNHGRGAGHAEAVGRDLRRLTRAARAWAAREIVPAGPAGR